MGRRGIRPRPVSCAKIVLSLLLLPACAHEPQARRVGATYPAPRPRAEGQEGEGEPGPSPAGPRRASPDQVGLATWYGKRFQGKPTSNGERFDARAMTAAHRKLPFGTWVEVRRPDSGRSVRVRINDRGPWGDDRRIIDLAQAAAEELGIVAQGVAYVELYVVAGP
jgi:rare lipoprotein A